MIDVAGLRVMRAIAREGSFTAAATSLGYSQPAVSQMVRRLEERTGTVLVQRLGRTVRLTEAGEVLARHADPVLRALEQAESEVRAIAGLQAGRVRLQAFPSASSTLVPQALAVVKERFPEVEIGFSEAEPPEALAALRAGECDLALTFAYAGDDLAAVEDELEPFVVKPLFEDEVRLVVARDHPMAQRKRADLEEVAEEPWIAGCARCRSHLVNLARDVGFIPRVTFETEDYNAVLGLVAAGLGVAVVPALILGSVRHDGVVDLPVKPASTRTVHVVTTPDLRMVPAVAAAFAALIEITSSLHAPFTSANGIRR